MSNVEKSFGGAKKFVLLISALFLVFVLFQPSQAVSIGGNSQYYNVVFDKEGEAAIYAKLNYENVQTEAIKELVVTIPGQSTRVINAIQETTGSHCIEPLSNSSKYPDKQSWECTSLYSTIKYDKKSVSDGLQLTLSLPTPLESQKSTSILLYYKATGYVTQKYGIYSFAFQTTKSDYDLQTVRVAINVQSELYLKEGKSEVSYLPNTTVFEGAKELSSAQSTALYSTSRSIEEATGFEKSTSSLDPGENFVVKGKYYSSSILAQWESIVGVGAVLILLAVLIIYIIKKEKKED